jgi:hypothetical protein
VLSGLVVVVVGLRARGPLGLDLAVLVNASLGMAFTIALQASRPPDYYLPAIRAPPASPASRSPTTAAG